MIQYTLTFIMQCMNDPIQLVFTNNPLNYPLSILFFILYVFYQLLIVNDS